jgi:hypothetical protein
MEAAMAIPKILDWRPVPRNSLLGFAQVEFPSGLIINDVTVLTGERGPWASPPSKPMIGADGVALRGENNKPRYVPIIEFASKDIRNKWSNSIIEAMREAHPDVFS